MIEKLYENKIPIVQKKAPMNNLPPVSGMLAALLVKYPNLQQLARRSFITYLKSIHQQKDKEVFDINKLPYDEFSTSLGLPIMTPRIRFLRKGKRASEDLTESPADESMFENSEAAMLEKTELQEEVFLKENTLQHGEEINVGLEVVPKTRVLKKKKLKINVNRPVGTRVVFDEEGNSLPPLARLDDANVHIGLDKDKVFERYAKLRETVKVADKEDKTLDRERRKEMRMKKKRRMKRGRDEEEEDGSANEDYDISGSDREAKVNNKKSKIYFDRHDDDDGESRRNTEKSIAVRPKHATVAEQLELAIQMLNSMNS